MSNTTLQQAVIYARYSSHSQRDVSIEQQLRACEAYAQRLGLQVVGTYDDRALTGTSDKRPGFQQMISDSRHGTWSYVIVYTLDRFARDRYDSAIYKRQLKENGVKVLSAMEQISDDPTGVLMESILEGYAEYYSKELSRKIRRGMEDNARKCMVNGTLPLGYVRGSDGRYAVKESEAAIVREAYERVSQGTRLCTLIDDFNARGILTKTKKRWNKSSFNKLLSNERYTGVYIYGNIRIPGGIPQIITSELFTKVQAALQTKANPRAKDLPQRRRRDNGTYYLTGKLFCGHCTSPMVGVSGISKNGSPHYYYSCRTHRAGSCDKKPVRRDHIEYTLAKALQETMLTDKSILALSETVWKYQQENARTSELVAMEERLAETDRALNNLVSAIEAGIFTATTQSRLLELEAQKRDLSAQIILLKEAQEKLLTKEEIAATLKLFQSGDLQDKSYQESLIDTFLVAAYLYDDHLKIVFSPFANTAPITLPIDLSTLDPTVDRITPSSLHQQKSPFCLPDKRGFFE